MNIDLEIQKAVKYIEKKEYKSAEDIYKKILSVDEKNVVVLSLLGVLYFKSSKYGLAEKFLKKSFEIKETNMLVKLLAFTYYELGQYKEASKFFNKLVLFDDSLDIKKKYIKILYLHDYDYEYALKFALEYYSQRPFELDNIIDLSHIYLNLGYYNEALSMCQKASQISPKDARVWLLKGLINESYYFNNDEAKKCYIKAARYGAKLEAQYNLCISHSCDNKPRAIQIGRKLLKNKDFIRKSEIFHTVGTNYFYLRNMRTGYKYYIHTWEKDGSCFKNFWDGTPHLKSTLFLHLTSGYGDQFMLIRYLPMVSKFFKKIIIPCKKEVFSLFKNSYSHLKNVEFFIHKNDDFEYDYFTSINLLQYALDSDFYHIPYSSGYLSCSDSKIDKYNKICFDNTLLKVGLCWKSGGNDLRWSRRRSVSLEKFAKFENIEGVKLYSIQKEINDLEIKQLKEMNIVDLGSTFKDFEDTAGAIKNLDVLISVDTSVSNLSGALGVKTCLLLPVWADWRWFDNTKKSEWYDSIDIFKQEKDYNWDRVVGKIYENIQVMVDSYNKK